MARHTLNLAVNSSCDGLPTKTTLHSKFNTTVQDFIAFALALAQCKPVLFASSGLVCCQRCLWNLWRVKVIYVAVAYQVIQHLPQTCYLGTVESIYDYLSSFLSCIMICLFSASEYVGFESVWYALLMGNDMQLSHQVSNPSFACNW